MRPRSLPALLVALLFAGAAGTAQAADGILLAQKITSGTTTQTNQVQIEKTRMRTTISGLGGASQTVIFDGGKQVLFIVDAARKTYSEITKADVDRLGAQLQGMMAMMQQQMANMPPAQRAQIESMMAGRGMASPAKLEYRKGGTDKVGRWTCDVYESYQNGQKTGELCTVAPTALGFSSADFAVTGQMAAFLSAVIPQSSGQIAVLGNPAEQGFAGFPVKSTATTGGTTITMEVSEVSRQTFPDSLFTIPPDYQKQDMLAGLGGMGRGR